MGAESKQQDGRDRNADQPQQDGAHDNRLLLGPRRGNNDPGLKLFLQPAPATGTTGAVTLSSLRPSSEARNITPAA